MSQIFIKTPQDLRDAIARYPEENVVMSVAKYKWYNWYQNIHIKMGSDDDKENTLIFEELKVSNPQLHQEVEEWIDYEIEKLKK